MTRIATPELRRAELDRRIRELVIAAADENVLALVAGADEWAVSPGTAHLLAGLVEWLKPASTLEFGAGRSSLVLATGLQKAGGGRLTSVEHQPGFALASWKRMPSFTAVDAWLVDAPLRPQWSKHGLLHVYVGIEEALHQRGPFDFVFIDAPPGDLGRDATLFTAAAHLAPDAVIVLDDGLRPREQTAVARWERALPVERVFESGDVGRGVVVLQARGTGRPAFSWRTFLGTLHDRFIGARYR
jgi:predicted O-methyltransferase YrrM